MFEFNIVVTLSQETKRDQTLHFFADQSLLQKLQQSCYKQQANNLNENSGNLKHIFADNGKEFKNNEN